MIYDRSQLIKCNACYDNDSNKKVVKQLIETLVKYPVGNKLACNQLGITDHRIAVVNIKYPLYLINPRIIKKSIPTGGISDCLSFPQVILQTHKFASIVVEADNLSKPTTFGVNEESDKTEFKFDDPEVQRCFAIQHVIDLLDGITMYDRDIKKINQPLINDTKLTRNSIVTIKRGEEEKQIKFKLFNNFKLNGWQLKN